MKTLISAIVATLAFATSMTFATTVTTNTLPWVSLNISGTIIYQGSSTTNAMKSEATLKTLSFNTKSLIALYNASTNFQTILFGVTGTNQIPAGSYFVFDPWEENLFITNNNGFAFKLYGYDGPTLYNFGNMEIGFNSNSSGYGSLIGSCSINTNTFAGSEQDQSAISFYFYDGNGNEFASYGNETLNWHYDAASGGVQKASLSISAQPSGWYAYVNDNQAITKGMKISGSGSSTIYSLDGVPFFVWWEEYSPF